MQLGELAVQPGLARIAFGNLDFGADARVGASGAALDHVRFMMAMWSRTADLPAPIDGVTIALDDEAQILGDVSRAREFGFGAKLCVHPRQVGPVNRGFAPAAADLDWARRIVLAMGPVAGPPQRSMARWWTGP